MSRDQVVVDAYLADPLCGFGIDAASTRDMFTGARRLADPDEISALRRDLPLYVVVGADDPVNAGPILLWPLVDRFRVAGLTDVMVWVYDEARHEIFNETNRTQVLDDLVQWLIRTPTNQGKQHD